MSSRDTVVIHKNMVAGLRDLPRDIAGEVMVAFFAIRFDGADMGNYPPLVRFALSGMFASVDDFDQRFESTKAARAEAGRKSGEARRAKRDAARAEAEQTNKTNKTNKPQQNERVGVGVGVGVGETEHTNTQGACASSANQDNTPRHDVRAGCDEVLAGVKEITGMDASKSRDTRTAIARLLDPLTGGHSAESVLLVARWAHETWKGGIRTLAGVLDEGEFADRLEKAKAWKQPRQSSRPRPFGA